jgi:hypothetical protein
MKKQYVWLLATLAAVLVVGCMSQKAPAEAAISSAETALGAVRDTAQKYVPDQLQTIDAQIAGMKDSFAKGDYQSVLAQAGPLNNAIGGLKDAAEAKKADVEAELARAKDAWTSASTDVPKMVAAIQSRVDTLSKSRHLPAGVTKDSLTAAKTGLDSMKQAWTDASNSATSGDFGAAMTKAQAVKDQATQLMKSLNITSS